MQCGNLIVFSWVPAGLLDGVGYVVNVRSVEEIEFDACFFLGGEWP